MLQAAVALAASAPVTRPPLEAYRALRVACPAPGLFLLRMGEVVLAGSAPGTLLRRTDDLLEARPASGARPRGRDAEEDARLAEALPADEAERAAHALLVDLARSDLGALSQPGTVETREFLAVERGGRSLRLATTVRGRAREGLDPLDGAARLLPARRAGGRAPAAGEPIRRRPRGLPRRRGRPLRLPRRLRAGAPPRARSPSPAAAPTGARWPRSRPTPSPRRPGDGRTTRPARIAQAVLAAERGLP